MSSIADGLDISPDPAGIETDEGFMASLARDLGLDGGEPPAPTPVPAPAGEAGDDDGDNSGTPDDDDASLTPEQKELKNLHALLGRQAEELGELRKRVDATPDPEPEDNFVPMPITDEVTSQIEELLEKNAGEDVAYWALTNAPHLYETVLDTWAEQSGAAARRSAEFNFRYQSALATESAKVEADEAREFQTSLGAALEASLGKLAPEYGLTPGQSEDDVLLAEALESAPAAIQKLVVSRDASEREDGLHAVLAMAAVKSAAAGATPPVDDNAALLAAAKGAAALGGGSLRPAPTPAAAGNTEADFLTRLKEQIIAAPSTSVAEGLTFGKQ